MSSVAAISEQFHTNRFYVFIQKLRIDIMKMYFIGEMYRYLQQHDCDTRWILYRKMQASDVSNNMEMQ